MTTDERIDAVVAAMTSAPRSGARFHHRDRAVAYAAILATLQSLREPTDDLFQVGYIAQTGDPVEEGFSNLKESWRAMIDQAIADLTGK